MICTMEVNDLFGVKPQEVIRALVWKQPFASLMLAGKIETRNRYTNVRGKVLMIAGQKAYDYLKFCEISNNSPASVLGLVMYKHTIELQPAGKAIATGSLVDCRPMTKDDEDKCFVKYKDPWQHYNMKTKKLENRQQWCWIFEDVRAIVPFEIKGSQGWSILTQDIIDKIKYI